jgi:hypothetical protein
LEHRSLEIDIEQARFYYQCEERTGRWPFRKWKTVKEYWDYTDPEIRKDFKARGFKLKIIR